MQSQRSSFKKKLLPIPEADTASEDHKTPEPEPFVGGASGSIKNRAMKVLSANNNASTQTQPTKKRESLRLLIDQKKVSSAINTFIDMEKAEAQRASLSPQRGSSPSSARVSAPDVNILSSKTKKRPALSSSALYEGQTQPQAISGANNNQIKSPPAASTSAPDLRITSEGLPTLSLQINHSQAPGEGFSPPSSFNEFTALVEELNSPRYLPPSDLSSLVSSLPVSIDGLETSASASLSSSPSLSASFSPSTSPSKSPSLSSSPSSRSITPSTSPANQESIFPRFRSSTNTTNNVSSIRSRGGNSIEKDLQHARTLLSETEARLEESIRENEADQTLLKEKDRLLEEKGLKLMELQALLQQQAQERAALVVSKDLLLGEREQQIEHLERLLKEKQLFIEGTLREQLDTEAAQAAKLRQSTSDLQQDLETRDNLLAQSNQQIEELRRQLQSSLSSLAERDMLLVASNEDLKEKDLLLIEAEQRRDSLQESLEKEQAAREAATAATASLEAEILMKDQIIEAKSQEMCAQHALLEEKERSLLERESVLTDKENSLAQLSSQYDALLQEKLREGNERDRLLRELDLAHKDREDLLREKDEVNAELLRLTQEVANLQHDNDNLFRQFAHESDKFLREAENKERALQERDLKLSESVASLKILTRSLADREEELQLLRSEMNEVLRTKDQQHELIIHDRDILLSEKEDMLKKNLALLAERDKIIAEKDRNLQELRKEHENLDNVLREKELFAKKLQEEQLSNDRKIAQISEELTLKVRDLLSQLQDQEDRIADMENALALRDQALETLSRKLEEREIELLEKDRNLQEIHEDITSLETELNTKSKALSRAEHENLRQQTLFESEKETLARLLQSEIESKELLISQKEHLLQDHERDATDKLFQLQQELSLRNTKLQDTLSLLAEKENALKAESEALENTQSQLELFNVIVAEERNLSSKRLAEVTEEKQAKETQLVAQIEGHLAALAEKESEISRLVDQNDLLNRRFDEQEQSYQIELFEKERLIKEALAEKESLLEQLRQRELAGDRRENVVVTLQSQLLQEQHNLHDALQLNQSLTLQLNEESALLGDLRCQLSAKADQLQDALNDRTQFLQHLQETELLLKDKEAQLDNIRKLQLEIDEGHSLQDVLRSEVNSLQTSLAEKNELLVKQRQEFAQENMSMINKLEQVQILLLQRDASLSESDLLIRDLRLILTERDQQILKLNQDIESLKTDLSLHHHIIDKNSSPLSSQSEELRRQLEEMKKRLMILECSLSQAETNADEARREYRAKEEMWKQRETELVQRISVKENQMRYMKILQDESISRASDPFGDNSEKNESGTRDLLATRQHKTDLSTVWKKHWRTSMLLLLVVPISWHLITRR